MALAVTTEGGRLHVADAGLSVDHPDALVQVIVTTQGREYGDVVQLTDGALSSTGVPYFGAGTYIVRTYDMGKTTPLDEWKGDL